MPFLREKKEMHIKHNWILLTLSRIAKTIRETIINISEDGEILEPSFIFGGVVKSCSHFGKV